MIRIKYEIMVSEFHRILKSRGFAEKEAMEAAVIFANNSLDGVYSHGINRFPRVIKYLDKKEIDPNVQPTLEISFGAFERWNGNRGFGPLGARHAMNRACEIATRYGIGIVALGNNNHWLRGGSYGYQAADNGYIGICWSNTMPNMPAWGGKDRKIGNNPLVLAVPKSNGEHVVVDCAVSQFSYGKIEEYRLKSKELPFPGGYDENGNLTTNPWDIEKTWRVLPIGYWKGSGISILLDLISTILTNANSVSKIGKFENEVGLSQIMIAIDPTKGNSVELTDQIITDLIADIQASDPIEEQETVFYPGQRTLNKRKENTSKGIPVHVETWEAILKM